MGGGNLEPKILLEMEGIKGCASRKRGDEHKIETRKDGLANCVTSIDTDSMIQEPLKIPQATKQGYIECPVGSVFDASYPDSDKRRGIVQQNVEVSPALTINSEGAILRYEGVEESSILAVERTEEAKELRKKGIARFKDKQHKPRTDGLSNCITSCLKDNLLQEPKKYINNPLLHPSNIIHTYPPNAERIEAGIQYKGKWMMEGDAVDTSRSETFGTHIMDGISPALRSERPDANAVCVKDGVEYKGKFIKEGDGLYTDTSKDFERGGLDGISITLKAETHDAGPCVKKGARYRIRKLTEREVFRLMDVSEEDIDKIQAAGISKTAQYKLAGNSIVVSCLYHIFRKLFIEPGCEEQQLSLF